MSLVFRYLLNYEHFVVPEREFLAVEWNVQASVTGLDL